MLEKRGIVIFQAFEMNARNSITIGGSCSEFDLRKYLLYWDELDFPNNNHISTGISTDIGFLIQAKIAKRTHIEYPDKPLIDDVKVIVDKFLRAQQLAFEQNDKAEPGQWSIAHLTTTLIEPTYLPDVQPQMAIEFELYNMLPVPEYDVPLNDILEFKHKRQAELIALRIYLDEMYQTILSSADLLRGKNTNIIKLEQALKEIDRTLTESGIKKCITSLRGFVGCHWDSALSGAGFAAAMHTYIHMNQIDAACLGAGLSFTIKSILAPRKKEGLSAPLTYINSIKKEWPSVK